MASMTATINLSNPRKIKNFLQKTKKNHIAKYKEEDWWLGYTKPLGSDRSKEKAE